MAEVADTIGKDPALSAKVLRLVNSPAFGLRNQARTVGHALALLGLNAVRTLALSFSLVRDLRKSQSAGLEVYWKRSIISAVAGRELALALRFSTPDEAFLGALLQDIGMLALGRIGRRDYEKLAAEAGNDHARLAARELAALGCDHADVGRWLLETWHLPEPLRIAVGLSHRSPAELDGRGLPADVLRLARVVRLSGLVADIWIRGGIAETRATAEEAAGTVGLAPSDLDAVLARIAEALPQVAELFDIKLGTRDEITAVLDQASETLVMVTMRASRQADSARAAMDTLQQKARVLEEASTRDKLTGLFNRARFDSCLVEELAIAQRTAKPLSVIMADIDHFKRINDTWGHRAGDRILAAVAGSLGGRLRPRDMVARYGGEEFVLILPETDLPGAEVVAERIRKRIESTSHDIGAAEPISVTMSFGCAAASPPSLWTGAELLEAADRALYAAKRGGRNRVVLASPTPSPSSPPSSPPPAPSGAAPAAGS